MIISLLWSYSGGSTHASRIDGPMFVWEAAARADLRRLDRETAMRILLALANYGKSGEGDVKRLTDREGLYRLRAGKWRLFFDLDSPDVIRIHGIDNRGQAY